MQPLSASSLSSSASSPVPVLVQWLVDTRPLWPAATQTRHLATVAARALAALLSDDERAGVLKFFHVRDAKMALVSQLLKHLVVARCCGGVAWQETVITRDGHGKPVFSGSASASGSGSGSGNVVFNVSHQAGLVVLVAVYGGPGGTPATFDVGIDVVSPAERRTRDHQMIDEDGGNDGKSGWARFVDMHADVLSPNEVRYLTTGLPAAAPTNDPTARNDLRLRYFYALWCLREAYVKMTGEALLAPWLSDLEFRNFVPPGGGPENSDDASSSMVVAHDIRFAGQPVDDARVCLRSVGTDYMVCTAVRSRGDKRAAQDLAITDAFEVLQMDDILDFASRSMANDV